MKVMSPMVQLWSRRFILLGVTLAAGAMYYEQSTNHILERQNAALKERIEDARRMIAEMQEQQARAKQERAELDAIHEGAPPTPALVWFPGRVKQHFQQFEPGPATRLNTSVDEANLPGFERTYWAIEMAAGKTSSEAREICMAIAEFERLNASVRVVDVAIRPDTDNPEARLMVVNVSVLSPKRLRS